MRCCTFAWVGSASILFALPVLAQESAAGGDVLQEVIVTSQKRVQNLQDVPVAVSAVTGESLKAMGIAQFSDLTQISPSLTLTVGTQPANNSVVLRGIGTLAFSTGVEPSVAVLIDDLPVLQQTQAFANLSDIERVEVLRGPQGTLFGKSSSAGVINIVTRAPSEVFSGSVNASATSDGQYLTEAAINGALASKVTARLSAFWQNNDGFIDNLSDNGTVGDSNSWGARLRVNAELTDSLKLDLEGRRTHDVTHPAQTFLSVPANATIFGVRVAGNLTGATPRLGNDAIRTNFDNSAQNDTLAFSGKATWDLGSVSLVSITGWQQWNYSTFIDADNMALPIFNSPLGVYNYGPYRSRLWTQELRLVSGGSGPFQYVTGLYYADGKTSRNFVRFPTGSAQANDWTARNGSRSEAAFAQGTYDFTPATHLDFGARYNREEISVTFVDSVLPTPAPTANCLATCAGEDTGDAFTYKGSLRQDLAPDVMAYVSYATGFKGEAYDISSGFNPTKAANPVRAEESKAYEIGLKSRFFDDRAQMNVALFRSDYDNFQAQSAVVLPNGTNSFNLSNVGKLRTQGIEVETTARPISALTFSATAAYTDAEIRSFPKAQCFPGQTAAQGCIGGLQDLSGKRPPNSPKFRYTLSARYDAPVPGMNFNGFLQADYRHQSRTTYDLLNNPIAAQDAYGIADLAIGVHGGDAHRFTASIYAKNLFDKVYAATVSAPAGASAGLSVQSLARDYRRYVGIRLGYDF